MSKLWLELLLTDSLNRPLANARYALHAGQQAGRHNLLREGQLDASGRLALCWRPEGLALTIGYRTLVLTLGPTQGHELDRNRLSCLGLPAGAPDSPVDPALVQRSLDALCAYAHHDGIGDGLDPDALLAEWVRGRIGVEPPPLPPKRRRRRRRRLRLRRRRAQQLAATEPHADGSRSTEPPGSHAHAVDEPFALCKRVWLALTAGPRGSSLSFNRILIYDWFTSYGYAPTAGNSLRALIDGEAAWGAAADDIEQARDELCVTTWWADPDIELQRPIDLALHLPAERKRHRFAAYVERLAKRGGRTTILLWNWVGTPILHPTLRRWATEGGDNVEVMQRSHPKLTGSFHQKTMVIDRRVAYCGGFNLRQNDWDTQAHRLDDPRRNPHETSGDDRRRPLAAYPPRHDVAVRVEGPLVADVHDNFVQYWNSSVAKAQLGVRSMVGRVAARITGQGPVDRVAPMDDEPAGHAAAVAQLVRTDPQRRPREQAIYDMLLRAIRNAHRFIYIENQYFRSRPIAQALVRALRLHPALQLVVVTNHIDPPWRIAHGGAYFTARMQRRLRTVRPDFCLYELLACGLVNGAVHYQPIELHAKVMVVDDEWATVGSANLNERSIWSDPEANVAVENEAFATDLRCRLMAEHLALEPTDPRITDLDRAASLWHEHAHENARARAEGRLAAGHAHPFEQLPSAALLRGSSTWF
jgi:phosphatidylserine/phosphatidylglycerophosphate/cardiolipin synthase-like enzyme